MIVLMLFIVCLNEFGFSFFLLMFGLYMGAQAEQGGSGRAEKS
jgi:hypothetical protein